ncbi:enediyne biosynthesis protein UnbU [Microbispora sp. RL4-1S]|uniref:Enediyne biosynthesis protein UnbU n=1 Tax=Microbispora oryzae TaxID=2806554 RepID=A0A940WGY2_9ACTN|nr:enediyne biosynthesis protein UnbU [Microbispora oryzae]MBP2702997.1 enediyne biosynthesis protein UnbU [Microbispora oryzae]
MNSARTTARTPARRDPRTAALRRFALSITVFTLLGHLWLGFEQAYVTPIAAVGFAYLLDLALETAEAWADRREPKYRAEGLFDFLLPAHISGLACAMLLYANDRLWPVLFAVAVAIGTKYLIRVRVSGRRRHILNPSNAGIAVTLLVFPWVGIAPPYHFTEWVGSPIDWLIPGFILVAGTMLNAGLTKKTPLILGWVGAFFAQALIRTWIEGTATTSALLVMTGVAFVLFTNYMITDPGTTPVRPRNQVVFGAATAVVYGLLVHLHVVYGLFFALIIVCACRGLLLAALALRTAPPRESDVQAPATSVAVPSSR